MSKTKEVSMKSRSVTQKPFTIPTTATRLV